MKNTTKTISKKGQDMLSNKSQITLEHTSLLKLVEKQDTTTLNIKQKSISYNNESLPSNEKNIRTTSIKVSLDTKSSAIQTNSTFMNPNSENYHSFCAFRRISVLDENGEYRKYQIPGITPKGQKHVLLAYQGEIKAIATHYPTIIELTTIIDGKLDFHGKPKTQFVQFLKKGVVCDFDQLAIYPQANNFFQQDAIQKKLLNYHDNHFQNDKQNALYMYIKKLYLMENNKMPYINYTDKIQKDTANQLIIIKKEDTFI